MKWIAWNLDNGTDPPQHGAGIAAFAKARELWDGAGIAQFPWAHCRSIADVERLIAVAESEGSPAIGLNIEDVVTDKLSLQEVGNLVLDFWVNKYEKPVHMATLCWVQNGQGWQHMAFAVAALEIFIDEVPACGRTQDCIDHALAEGLPKVTLMLKTKPPNTPATYGEFFSICHSLYTADDITPDAPSWAAWKAPAPCTKIVPSVPPIPESRFPNTAPYYGPSSLKGPMKGKTAKALKRAQIRLGNFQGDLGSLDEHYNAKLEDAMRDWQHKVGLDSTGQYGRASWQAMRYAQVPAGPHKGEYAMDAVALKLVREDALAMCYPHLVSANSSICQGLHETDGLNANWAIDFCCPGGTPVVAVEKATITRLSGRDPALGANQTIGIFGWSIHYETANGYRYFSTHYGSRSVQIGQIVECGQIIGTVGSWPGNPGRSHTHLGVTSPLGTADAKKRITAVSQAPRV